MSGVARKDPPTQTKMSVSKDMSAPRMGPQEAQSIGSEGNSDGGIVNVRLKAFCLRALKKR